MTPSEDGRRRGDGVGLSEPHGLPKPGDPASVHIWQSQHLSIAIRHAASPGQPLSAVVWAEGVSAMRSAWVAQPTTEWSPPV